MVISLAIVEDHEVVRLGLLNLFSREPDIDVVCEAATGADALEAVATHRPDVVLLDMRLPDAEGVEICKGILAASPETRILILTSYADREVAISALAAGAAGFLLKGSTSAGIKDAVRAVASGKYLLEPSAMEWLLKAEPTTVASPDSDIPELRTLTAREREILNLLGKGMTNKEIARELHLSVQTVKNYVSNLLTKLSMSRRSEAAAFVARLPLSMQSETERLPGNR